MLQNTNFLFWKPKHTVVCEEFLSDLHELQLERNIVNEYLKYRRMHQNVKLSIEKFYGKDVGIRQKFAKLILFHNL